MITPTQIYWLTRLDSIKGFGSLFVAFSIMLFFCLVFLTVGKTTEEINEGKSVLASKLGFFVRLVTVIFLASLLPFIGITCFVPTTREMAAIIIVPKIANSEKVQQAGNQLYTLAVEWMEELRPSKNNGAGNGK